MSALQQVADARGQSSDLQCKTLIPRPHLMWCPWKQQKILTKNVRHLCGSLKSYWCFSSFFKNSIIVVSTGQSEATFSVQSPFQSVKGEYMNNSTSVSPLLSHYPQSLCWLATSLEAIIPLANQYLSNQRFSYRLGWSAQLNTLIQTVICTENGI